MLDALLPYAAELAEVAKQRGSLVTALTKAYDAACQGATATTAMVPTHGRARTWGERAVGHIDPGARSFSVIAGALVAALEAA